MAYEILYLLSLIEWRCVWMLPRMMARMDFVLYSDMFFIEGAVTTATTAACAGYKIKISAWSLLT